MKKIVMSFLGIIVALGFVSCGGGGTDTIKYMMWGQPEEIKAVQNFVKEFNQQFPDTKVELIHASDYYSKLQTMIAGGTAPDVMYMDSDSYPGYIKRGALFDITDFIKNDPETNLPKFNIKNYFDTAQKPFLYKKQYYGVSKDFTPLVLYYNKDLFDKAGVSYPNKNWTWDDFRKAAMTLTKDTDGDKNIDQYGFVFESWMGYWLSWVRQNGGKVFDTDSGQYVIGKEPYLSRNVETFQFLYNLMYKDHVAPTMQEAQDMNGSQLLETGRVAMATYGRWRTLELKNASFNWDIAELPYKRKRASTLFTVCYSISSQSKHKLKAWRLIKFLLGKQGQIATAESCLAIPSLKEIAYSEHFLKPKVLSRKINTDAFFNSLPYATPTPANANVQLFNDTIGRYLDDIFLKKKDIKQTLLALQKELDKLSKSEN